MCERCKIVTGHHCSCGQQILASGYCRGGHHVIFQGEARQFNTERSVSYPRPADIPGPLKS